MGPLKVGQLRHPVAVQEDGLRLQVAMHNPGSVAGLERLRDARRNGESSRQTRGPRLVARQELRKAAPFRPVGKFHKLRLLPIVLVVEHLKQVRVGPNALARLDGAEHPAELPVCSRHRRTRRDAPGA